MKVKNEIYKSGEEFVVFIKQWALLGLIKWASCVYIL